MKKKKVEYMAKVVSSCDTGWGSPGYLYTTTRYFTMILSSLIYSGDIILHGSLCKKLHAWEEKPVGQQYCMHVGQKN